MHRTHKLHDDTIFWSICSWYALIILYFEERKNAKVQGLTEQILFRLSVKILIDPFFIQSHQTLHHHVRFSSVDHQQIYFKNKPYCAMFMLHDQFSTPFVI